MAIVIRKLSEAELARMTKAPKSTGMRSQVQAEMNSLIHALPMNELVALDLDGGAKVLTIKLQIKAAVARYNAVESDKIAVVTSSRRGVENTLYVTKMFAADKPASNRGRKPAVKAVGESVVAKPRNRGKKSV